MLVIPHLIVFSILSVLVASNTEKTVFVAPPSLSTSDIHPGLQDLRLAVLAPSKHQSSLRTRLAVAFPTVEAPRGTQHWYLLDGLSEGQRYEVRVCWAASQPTQFWLTTYLLNEAFETPEVISALAAYSEQLQELPLPDSDQYTQSKLGADSSVLLLRIQSAADFYTTDQTLMNNPPLVHVDIILDPYLLNVLPRSLGPTVAYITALAICSWYISGAVWRWLASIKDKPEKERRE